MAEAARQLLRAIRSGSITFLALGTLLVLPLAVQATQSEHASVPERQQALQRLQARVSALQRELAASEETRDEAADALKASEQAISEASRRLFELADARREVERELGALRDQVATLEASIATQRAALEKLVVQQYRGGRYEPFRLLLGGQDPQAVARLLYYYRVLTEARAAALRELEAALQRERSLAQEALTKQNQLTTIAEEAQRQKLALEQERRQRAGILARISRQATQQKRRLATLQADEKRLSRLIDRLAKIARPTEKASPPARNDLLPEPSAGDLAFAQLKGKLALPVRGELTNRFGTPRSDGGALWKGLFIKCDSGQEVRAVAAGRVVFADWLRGFGNLLIIDHGTGYMSLYGNNEALLRQVGATVKTGEAVAQAGNSGGNPDSGVYFELRFQGRAFDPLSWVAKQSRQ